MQLKLQEIRLDGNTQPRSRVYDETVTNYTEALLDGAKFPPVDVFFDGKHYWLADGFHRYHAHRRNKIATIEATVHKLYTQQYTYNAPPQRKPLPKGEWPKHPSGYVGDVYKGYDKSDLDNYAMQVLAAHGIKH